MTRLKDIPALQRDGSNLSSVIQAVQEVIQTFRGYRGDKLDKALTLRDLSLAAQRGITGGGAIDVGIIGGTTPGAPVTDAYVIDLTPPPTPTGLQVDAGITSVFVSCDQPVYTQGNGHDVTVVYGAKWPIDDLTQPTFSEAVELFRYQGTFSAYNSDPATRWCIWIKWQSIDGVLSTDPAGGINGVVTTTGQDVSLLLEALSGQLTSSQLHADLGTPISLITAPVTTVGSIEYRLSEEAAARTAAITAEASARAAAILAEAGARTGAVSDLQNQINTVAAASGGDLSPVIAVVQEEQTARAAADAAEAASRETLAVQMRGVYTGTDVNSVTTGLIYSERQARISAQDAEVSLRNSAIVSSASDSEATQKAINDALIAGLGVIGGATATRTQAEQDARIASVTQETNARISAIDAEATARLALVAIVNSNAAILTSEQTVRATADTALSNRATTLEASVNSPTTGLATKANITQVATAKAEAIAASATVTDTISARLNTGDFSAVKIQSSASASAVTGLYAQYTVKLDVNGKVSGYGLASTGPTGAGSTFEIRSDKFAIAAGTGTAAGFVPFQVLSSPTVIDGATLPAGAYATKAFIQDLQVTNAKIASLAVDNAKIANLSAAKLTVGDGTVGGNLKSSNYVSGSAGWIIRPDGYAEMQNAVVRGTIYASAGTFTGTVSASTINGTTINSSTLNSGWVNIANDGGSGWGGVRSYNKWWGDGVNGWVLARDAAGNTLFELKGGSSSIHFSSWGDCSITFPKFSVDSYGNAHFSGTLAAGVATFDSIVSNSATSFEQVTLSCTNGSWASYTFYMHHYGYVSVIGSGALSHSGTGGSYSHNLALGDTSYYTGLSGSWYSSAAPNVPTMMLSRWFNAGWNTVYINLNISTATGLHNGYLAIFKSYR